jgi:hypothetical protein
MSAFRRYRWVFLLAAVAVGAFLLLSEPNSASGHLEFVALLPLLLLDILSLVAIGFFVACEEPVRHTLPLLSNLVPRGPPTLSIS